MFTDGKDMTIISNSKTFHNEQELKNPRILLVLETDLRQIFLPSPSNWFTTQIDWTVYGFYMIPANNYLFKINNRNFRKRCVICSKLTLKTPEWCYWCRSGVFIVNFEHISHLFLVFLLLTLSTLFPVEVEKIPHSH